MEILNNKNMENKIIQIMYNFSEGKIKFNLATKQILDLFGVNGMFSSEKLEQAYKDGVCDALTKGYGTFDEEKYR